MNEWHILTGAYPPQPGGVSDYTHQIARGLAAVGDQVHVWFGPCAATSPPDPGVTLHRLPSLFGPRALAHLEHGLSRRPREARVLLQYVPHAFGLKAMNLPFCWWLYRSRRRRRIWVMFHEVAFPLARTQPLKHNILGLVTLAMAALVARSAERCFASIPAWVAWLRRLGARPGSIDWLPVPSNLPTTVAPETVAAVRRRFAPRADQLLIGHFGTYGDPISSLLAQALPEVVGRDEQRVAVLIGRRGEVVADRLTAKSPQLCGRLFASGELDAADVAAHLAACDLLLQPYPDGISSRRTSAMAGLALGVPIVTTTGALTEADWQKERMVELAPASDPTALAAACNRLLTDSRSRTDLGRRGRSAYFRRFRIEQTVAVLRGQSRPPACAAATGSAVSVNAS